MRFLCSHDAIQLYAKSFYCKFHRVNELLIRDLNVVYVPKSDKTLLYVRALLTASERSSLCYSVAQSIRRSVHLFIDCQSDHRILPVF